MECHNKHKFLFSALLAVVIVLFFWIFFWKGTLEVTVKNSNAFQVRFTDGETFSCMKNPCSVLHRVGNPFTVTVFAPGFLSQEFEETSLKFLEKRVLEITLHPEPVIRKFLKTEFENQVAAKGLAFFSSTDQVFGKPVVDPQNELVLFAQKKDTDLVIQVKDKQKSEKVLTLVSGKFDFSQFSALFSLQDNGVVIPEEKGLFFFDLRTRNTSKIFDGDVTNISFVSVKDKDDFVLRTDDKKWHRLSSDKKTLPDNVRAAGFIDGQLWTLEKNTLSIDGKMLFEFREDTTKFPDAWFQNQKMYFRNDKDLWEVNLKG